MKFIPLPIISLTFFLLVLCGCDIQFDREKPDTKTNKDGFKRLVGFEPTNDMTELYFYADVFITDAVYNFAFKCDSPTVYKIVEKLALKRDSTILTEPANFWNNKFPKVKTNGDKYFFVHWQVYKDRHAEKLSDVEYYLYYDRKKKQAFLGISFK